MNEKVEKFERDFIRQGDILNPLGVMQAAMLYGGKLPKTKYAKLVRQNYPNGNCLSTYFEKNINSVWEISIKRFERMGILISDPDEKDIISINIFK